MVGTETRDIGKKVGIEVLIFRLLSIRWDGMEWNGKCRLQYGKNSPC